MEGEQKTSALAVVTPIAALVIGAIIGFIIGAGQGASEVARLQAQIDAAKKFFPAIPELRTISGTVKGISGNTITIESALSGNPFEELPKERTITVSGTTKFVALSQKDPAVFQKEMEAFSKTMSAGRTAAPQAAPVMPPMPFTEKTISLNDIKVGTMITVDANENIKEKNAFEATKITVAPVAQVPPMTPVAR